MMDRLLDKKVALVTGAGAGIGKATTCLFADEGAIVYALDIKGLEWIDSYLCETGTIIPVELDICDFSAVKNVVMSVKKEQERIDILANIAGLVSYEFENNRMLWYAKQN